VVDDEVKGRVKERSALVDPTDIASEAFRTLRLALELRSDARTGNTLLFTSPERGVGKTTVAANFALLSSLNDSSVLLVDCDLRAPKLHECFGLQRTPGLIELLASSSAELEDFVQPVALFGRLDLLTAGRPIPRSSDVTASPRMRELIGRAASQYDLVVIDAPPVLVGADAEGLATHAGVDVVLVVGPMTKRRAIEKAQRRMDLIEASVAGIVVNRAGRASATYQRY
jgi:tyrosine-protein kinase Etk/Wzc